MFQYRRLFLVALAYLLCVCSARQMQAQSTSLSFDSLPTAQGWVYYSYTTHSPVPESSVFSLSNSILQQNTIGRDDLEADYELINFGDASKPFVISMRARVLAEDYTERGGTYGFGFGFQTGTKYSSVSIMTNGFRIGSGSVLPTNIVTSEFHDYRIEGSPDGSFGFYVDNALFATSSAVLQSGTNTIYFGDLTPTGSNARADITSFSYSATITVGGTIALQGTQNTTQPLEFTFRPTTGISFNRTATLNVNGGFGNYSLAGIPSGNYTVSIKGAKWLRKNITVNASTGNVTNANATLLAGDGNNDNFADIADLLLLIAHYNQVSPNAGFLDAADFNCDGTNDIADLLLLIANYNKHGDS